MHVRKICITTEYNGIDETEKKKKLILTQRQFEQIKTDAQHRQKNGNLNIIYTMIQIEK